MKVCIIGNSHIAALKLGWQSGLANRWHGTDLTFYGARGGDIAELLVQDGQIAPKTETVAASLRATSGGHSMIDPLAYDAILVYGLCRDLNRQVQNLGTPYSAAALELAQLEYWIGSNLLKVISAIREIDSRPLYVGAAPLEAAVARGISDNRLYAEFIRTSNDRVFALADAILLPQPMQTIVNGDATDLRFSIGSTRLAVGDSFDDKRHPGEENRHMNAEYGALWLEQFLKRAASDRAVGAKYKTGAARKAAPEILQNH